MKRLLFLLMLALFLLPPSARAEDIIASITVEGNLRIDSDTVRAYMQISPGDALDPAEVDRGLKNLFGTGLFEDVSIVREGDGLIVRVRENPLVNIIAFEGNSEIDDEDLAAQIPLSPGTVFTRSKITSAIQFILQQYRRGGRFNAKAEAKIIRLSQNRINLVFEIDEGDRAVIKDIAIIGNRAYTDNELRGRIQTSVSAWWKILNAYDAYDPDRFEFDTQLLRNFYIRRGYADFSVVSAVAELAPDKSGFYLTIVIDEGVVYRFGVTEFESLIEDLQADDLAGAVTYETGDLYDAQLVSDALDNINDLAQERGYAFASIDPVLERDPEQGEIAVIWSISEASKSYIERVDIEGNSYTHDAVIRREIVLREGDVFNRALLSRSRRNLRALDFFERVTVEPSAGSLPGQVVLKTSVLEKLSGELSMGIGYSSLDGFVSDFSVRQKNFLGLGQEMEFIVNYSDNASQTFRVNFVEPWFRNRDLRLGLSVFYNYRDFQDTSDYSLREFGSSISLGVPAGRDSRLTFSYEVDSEEVYNVGSAASQSVRNAEGSTMRSIGSYVYSVDSRDDVRDPSNGWYFSWQQSVAGLGGEVNFIRSISDLRLYGLAARQAETRYIGALRARMAHITGYNGDDVLLNDRFFLGGRTLRGFDASGAGPRDFSSDDAVGANYYIQTTGELRVRTPAFLAFGLTPVFFMDAAYIGSTDAIDNDIVGEDALRLSVGISLFWDSPIGPMQFDFSDVLVREPRDNEESFRFTLGIPF